MKGRKIMARPDSAHFSQLVDRLKSMVNRLGKISNTWIGGIQDLSEKGGKLLVVEDLEATARRDLAHLALCRVMCRKKLFLILSTHHSIIFSWWKILLEHCMTKRTENVNGVVCFNTNRGRVEPMVVVTISRLGGSMCYSMLLNM